MLADAIRRFFETRASAPSRLLLALSGGTDSTALLLALVQFREEGFELVAAHVNHRLRGEESDADQDFVRHLCAANGVELMVADGTLDEAALRDRGIEAAAREVRRGALERMREECGAAWIVTAHHQGDQAETVLMRLLTGRGSARLGGIAPLTADGFLRPLLDVPKAEIEAFLAGRGITPRHDRSNDDIRFLRNRVRHELLPLLREYNPRIVETLAATAARAREEQALIDEALERHAKAFVERSTSAARFRLEAMPERPFAVQALLHRELRRLDPNARDVDEGDLVRLASELPTLKRTSVTRDLELVREGDEVVLRRKPGVALDYEIALTPEASIDVAAVPATLHLRPFHGLPDWSGAPDRQLFQLPPGAEAAFLVRNRRHGERFRPLGLPAEKKLNEFLIDRKIPREAREQIPLLVWNGKVVWVAGVAVSDEFKVTDPPGQLFEVILERRS
jgi:tRNA(Ile)-lysidine synthase